MEKRADMLNLMNAAKAAGAVGIEILRCHKDVLEQADARSKPQSSEEQRWSIQLWFADQTCGQGEAESKEEALSLALSNKHPVSKFSGPVERMMIRTTGTGIDDRRHADISDSDRSEVLQIAERALNSAVFKAKTLRYRQVRVARALVNSRGIEAEEFATTYELRAEVMVEGRNLQHRIASRHFSDVASLPFGTELKRRLEPMSRKVADVPQLPLVLEPRVMADLFRSLAPAFAADRIAAGTSFIKDYLGKRIASPIFHITDDAGLFGALLTRCFDDRGVPPIPVTLLKEGVVTGLYHSPESAREAELRPTGHVMGGALYPSNLIVRPGSRTRNVVLGELGSYLLLDRAPNLDIQTGMLEGPLELVVVEKGEKRGSVLRPFSAALTKVLGAVKEVVSDHERSAEVDAPTAVFAPGFGA